MSQIKKTDFQITIASLNGSGTLTTNRLLHKALFRDGYHVVGKNLFPSNIEGLPTYYVLRLSENYNSIKKVSDVYVGLNPQTFSKDISTLTHANSVVLTNSDLKLVTDERSANFTISYRDLAKDIDAPIKIKKRISNQFYVGWLGNLLGLSFETLTTLINESFSSETIRTQNLSAIKKGWDQFDSTATEELKSLKQQIVSLKKTKPENQILIEGNQAAALGWVDAGCTVATWYPITPSSSLVESFENYVEILRPRTETELKNYAVIQAEDEISAVCAVVGANWSGARAATATSGPGLSLMNEAIGLAYFAEIPAVIWDIQRMGPSTGLPTRTSQGDLLSAYYSSHGDTFHPILLPSSPEECYQMSFTAFDVAEHYQTPVLVLSDLDLGMNIWATKKFEQNTEDFKRGAVLSELDLEKVTEFHRYLRDENGVIRRTLPGTHHKLASYMTRGSGHNKMAGYTEDPIVFTENLEGLKMKILNARQALPKPNITNNQSKIGLIFYGSTSQIFPEIQTQLPHTSFDLCQIKSLPLHDEVYDFINQHEKVFVIEQNRDLQLMSLIKAGAKNQNLSHLDGISMVDGWPVRAEVVTGFLTSYFQNQRPLTESV